MLHHSKSFTVEDPVDVTSYILRPHHKQLSVPRSCPAVSYPVPDLPSNVHCDHIVSSLLHPQQARLTETSEERMYIPNCLIPGRLFQVADRGRWEGMTPVPCSMCHVTWHWSFRLCLSKCRCGSTHPMGDEPRTTSWQCQLTGSLLGP